MNRIGWLISRYLVTSVIPYFLFSWILLSVILFVRTASAYSDTFFDANIPSNLIWQLTVALIPNVVAFTCPMAMLVGTIIGLTKMQSDSELVAIRASGVGSMQIALPIMILGLLMSGFAFLINLKGVPIAASIVKNVALQTAIKKLESPIEPGVFNTQVNGYTIYVKGADLSNNTWKNIFIYNEDAANTSLRLITSKNGRLDISGDRSELVLENATVSTLPLNPGEGNYVTESIGEVRFAIKTKRNELLDKLKETELRPDELGLQELADYASEKTGPEQTEARIIWQRRLLLSITPLIFCILGTVIVLRFNRGGRGFAVATALGVLIGFYLLTFLGEQLARVGTIGAVGSSLIPVLGSLAAIAWLSWSRRVEFVKYWMDWIRARAASLTSSGKKIQRRNLFVDLTTGLRDFDLIKNLIFNFLLTLFFLSAIFVIFTAFELWKFAGTFDGGILLLLNYLVYLLPFIYLQISPSAAMVGTLSTYVIKSRNNEIVTWTSAGQSVFRLLWPCFVLMALLGLGNWWVQENVLPQSNRLQDHTREIIRNRGVPVATKAKYWVADERRIYSFSVASDNDKTQRRLTDTGTQSPASDNGNDDAIRLKTIANIETRRDISASDNAIRDFLCFSSCARNLIVYEFDTKGEFLQTVYRGNLAQWSDGTIRFFGIVEKNEYRDGRTSTNLVSDLSLDEDRDPFAERRIKPNHLSTAEIRQQIGLATSENERRMLEIGLQKKYATVFLPMVMALFTAPFALSLSRKGKAATVGYAILLWLIHTGTSTIFEQAGASSMLSPTLAIWAPLAIFASLGVLLLSKVRT